MRGKGRGRKRGWGRGRRAAWFIEPFLLLLLDQGAAHGYTLLDQLRELGLEQRNPSALYRSLRDMEALGYVTSTWDEEQTQGPPRRVYQLTPMGTETLQHHAHMLNETQALINHFLQLYQIQQQEKEKP